MNDGPHTPEDDLDFGQTVRGLSPGQCLFQRYRLRSVLGRGGMGVVWLADDEQLDCPVALKFLPEIVTHDRQAIADLKREVIKSRALNHHHIVRVHDFVTDGVAAAISMEYVDGGTLSDLRLDQPGGVFEPEALLSWVEQLCSALTYAHGTARLVHRDLKPKNLMITSKGELKVADFGISRSITESASMGSLAHSSSGSPPYMSPQQIAGESPSPADDIYAVGATLYELLTGRPPFYRGGALAIMDQVKTKVPERVNERRRVNDIPGEVPAHWEETIAACLAKDPAARPQSAVEVWERLNGRGNWQAEAIHLTPVPEITKREVSRVAHTSEPARQKLRNKGVIIATLVALLLAGGAAGWWFGIEAPKRAETSRIAKVTAEADQRQREEAESSRIAEDARRKKESEDASENERVRLTKEKKDTEERQKQMAGRAEAEAKQRQAALDPFRTATKEKPFINSLGMEFVPVPIVGGPTGGNRVLFSVWDVRVRDYRAFTEEMKREWAKPSFEQTDEHPAVNVSWDDAKAFCEWLTKKERAAGKLGANESYQLPSDHEWSCAVGIGEREDARASPAYKSGKIDHVFPWGTQWPPPKGAGNYDSSFGVDDFAETSPVGSFAANKFGLYDIGGNVWQWCEDRYDSSGSSRVLRGGSWYINVRGDLLSSYRVSVDPTLRIGLGFRVVVVGSSATGAAAAEKAEPMDAAGRKPQARIADEKAMADEALRQAQKESEEKQKQLAAQAKRTVLKMPKDKLHKVTLVWSAAGPVAKAQISNNTDWHITRGTIVITRQYGSRELFTASPQPVESRRFELKVINDTIAPFSTGDVSVDIGNYLDSFYDNRVFNVTFHAKSSTTIESIEGYPK